ncbi:DUF1707 domain-containing protein [Allokutzneria sp. A3M-2-11 16]|uniref:DUF1707 SHOCT-like domain-containing protein n=1 Tax=Allokutzneria sp. A3M-2-11 16 TaxID=2962043 RepID=UPI0020B8F1ED|nr:DUF1707 domain-containing protein [Allokutzneria sp. A3M-2-11 16]MCP3800439.1 DUF1707 domain-containing protein [Allokutzneria sp. A3M-2-11 16]
MTQPLDPQTRIGDTERAEAQRMLAEHLEAGRLTTEEYGERAALAGTARCTADLLPLFADLPGHHRPAVPVSFAPRPQQQHGVRSEVSGPIQALAISAAVFMMGCVGAFGLTVLTGMSLRGMFELVAVAGVLSSMLFVALGLVRMLRPTPSRPYDQQGG